MDCDPPREPALSADCERRSPEHSTRAHRRARARFLARPRRGEPLLVTLLALACLALPACGESSSRTWTVSSAAAPVHNPATPAAHTLTGAAHPPATRPSRTSSTRARPHPPRDLHGASSPTPTTATRCRRSPPACTATASPSPRRIRPAGARSSPPEDSMSPARGSGRPPRAAEACCPARPAGEPRSVTRTCAVASPMPLTSSRTCTTSPSSTKKDNLEQIE